MLEDFAITQAVSVILFLMKDKKKARKWLPQITKIRDAALIIAPLEDK